MLWPQNLFRVRLKHIIQINALAIRQINFRSALIGIPHFLCVADDAVGSNPCFGAAVIQRRLYTAEPIDLSSARIAHELVRDKTPGNLIKFHKKPSQFLYSFLR